MRHEITNDWLKIKKDFLACQKSSGNVVHVASVDEKGTPNQTPIGSMFLADDKKAFFCNRFLHNLNRNTQKNDRICVIALNTSSLFWLRALFKGRFPGCPGIRLYGRLGARREIQAWERQRWEKRVKAFKWSKGYSLLWKDMSYVSDIEFDSYEYLNTGKMAVRI